MDILTILGPGNLPQAQQLGKFFFAQPAALLHQHAMRQRQHATKTAESYAEKAQEQLTATWNDQG
jgi:hypothetical protein